MTPDTWAAYVCGWMRAEQEGIKARGDGRELASVADEQRYNALEDLLRSCPLLAPQEGTT